MKFWLKVQKIMQGPRQEIVVGVCDEELLGKNLGETKISEQFFKGELVEIENAVSALKNATIGNIFGKNIVNMALKNRIIEESGIKKIEGIPHAQIFLIH